MDRGSQNQNFLRQVSQYIPLTSFHLYKSVCLLRLRVLCIGILLVLVVDHIVQIDVAFSVPRVLRLVDLTDRCFGTICRCIVIHLFI